MQIERMGALMGNYFYFRTMNTLVDFWSSSWNFLTLVNGSIVISRVKKNSFRTMNTLVDFWAQIFEIQRLFLYGSSGIFHILMHGSIVIFWVNIFPLGQWTHFVDFWDQILWGFPQEFPHTDEWFHSDPSQVNIFNGFSIIPHQEQCL